MEENLLQFILYLSTTIVLPTSLWIISSSRIFSQLRRLTQDNYQDAVRETIERTIIERICQLLDDLFPQYGLTPPRRSAPFPTIVRHLLNESEAPDRLHYLADFYKSLVENGIQSPFFGEVVQAVLTIIGGGG